MVKKSMIEVRTSELKPTDIYKLMIGSIIPRPIAWVSTQNKNGVGNCAPFSFFNGVSSHPPCLSISITRNSKGEKKDTLKNIEETKVFCVNLVHKALCEPMNQTSAEYPYGVDEAQAIGLTTLPCTQISAPRIQESLLQMECSLYKAISIGDGSIGSATLVLGEILCFHFHESIYQNGKIDPVKLAPIARLAGTSYSELGKVFSLLRPKIERSNIK